MRRRRRHRLRRPLVATAVALGAAGAAAGAAVRAQRRRRRTGAREPGRREWSCSQCGARYEVSGTDRHRIYWPAGAGSDQPVLDAACVRCGGPLPREHEGTPAPAPSA